DRQGIDLRRDSRRDVKHPAGIAAADGELAGARAGDGQVVVGDGQFTAGQGDAALQARGKDDLVGAVVGVGVEDGLPQRAGTAVGEGAHRVGVEQGPVLKEIKAGPEAPPPGGPAGRLAAGTDAQPRTERTSHDPNLLPRNGLRWWNETVARARRPSAPGHGWASAAFAGRPRLTFRMKHANESWQVQRLSAQRTHFRLETNRSGQDISLRYGVRRAITVGNP